MGYCIDLKDKDFTIKKENAEAVVQALKEFAKTHKHIMWVVNESLIEAKDIKECFEEIRYSLVEVEDVYKIDDFIGEKLGNDKAIFDTIAKYVEKGSYIIFHGEDGDIFGFSFDGETCKERMCN